MNYNQEAIRDRIAFLNGLKNDVMPSSKEGMLLSAKIRGLEAIMDTPPAVLNRLIRQTSTGA